MALKGQKFRKYSVEFREQVVKEKLGGASYSTLVAKYSIPEGSITTWLKAYKRDGAIGVRPKGRPKPEDESGYRERYEILKKFQDFLAKAEQEKRLSSSTTTEKSIDWP
jgi:transposase-like protein